MSDEFFTTDDFINANRSPPLQPTRPNYRSVETPPPLIDIDSSHYFNGAEIRGEGGNASTFKSTKGPDYPEVASKAGREFFILSPEIACEDHKPLVVASRNQMLDDSLRRGVSMNGVDETKVLARAAFEASEKLNAAIHKDGRGTYTSTILQPSSTKHRAVVEVHEVEPDPVPVANVVRRSSVDHRFTFIHTISPEMSPQKVLNVRPPPKVSLPAIRTKSPTPRAEWADSKNDSIATSPALAKFTIAAADGNPQQQLPRMQTSPSQSQSGQSPPSRQTLPSLKTALNQIPGSDVTPYTAQTSSTLSRPSPGQYSQFGPSPSTYSSQSPASALSPPRLSSNPSYWKTGGAETSNSTPSDQASAAPSAGISTPTSSYFGHSPANSVSTPGTIVPDSDGRNIAESSSAISTSSSQVTDGSSQYGAGYGNGSFKCTFMGCNAQPFQTQYLLNSHANVHSNTRPHFCPVQGCPRGPGGQGFKRKNEMIRHGLVHQSPGYVCPFCPDQQHKYPRPDNLQRHVRVHHGDRDRDDALLREVLAQRPEGGNRGRRRRLGS